jgi:Zn-dependent protease with chaperone function
VVTTVRAALSVVMLAGFYVVAIGLVVALGVVSALAFENGSGVAGGKLALLAVVAMAGIVVALWRVARARPAPQPGVVLTPTDAPELWALVTRLAGVADTRVPDEIRLVPEVNAAVSEDARWLGLVPGARRLYLGVPLLVGLDVARLTSVLGHELGHYSRSHTRLAPIAYRGRAAIFATLEQLSGNLVGWLLRQYAKLYVLVSAGVTRRQELEADELSVRVAGRQAAQGALLELPVIDRAWDFYEQAYLAPGWEVGVAPTPDQFFAGFVHLLEGRGDDLAGLRAAAPPDEQSRWDSHPSIAARVAAMERVPEQDVAVDARPAAVLVPGLAAAATRLADEVVNFGDRRRVPWEELTATALAQSGQRGADVVYRAAARVSGQQRATLGTVLDLVSDGRGDALAQQLGVEPYVPEQDADGTLADAVESVLTASLVQAELAGWRHSWSGPAVLLDRTGQPVALDELARLAAHPSSVAGARQWLASAGVDVQSTGQVAERASAHGSALLGGLANVEVDGAPHDVLVLNQGLVLVPCPKKTDGGKARLREVVGSASVVDLARRHRFLPFEEVATSVVHKRAPARLDLVLHDGSRVAFKELWSSELLTKDSSTTFVAIAGELAASAESAPAR